MIVATHALEVAERFVNRAVRLVHGKVWAEWNRSEIDAIRDDPALCLEASMAEAMT